MQRLVIFKQTLSKAEASPNSFPSPTRKVYPLFEPSIRCDKTQLWILFDCVECQNEELCGGKGSSLGFLAILARQSIHNFAVPDGFVLSSAAFKQQLNYDKRPGLLESTDVHPNHQSGCQQ